MHGDTPAGEGCGIIWGAVEGGMFVADGSGKRKALCAKGLRRQSGETRRPPVGPPARRAYQVNSPLGFFLPVGPHVSPP